VENFSIDEGGEAGEGDLRRGSGKDPCPLLYLERADATHTHTMIDIFHSIYMYVYTATIAGNGLYHYRFYILAFKHRLLSVCSFLYIR